MVISFLQKNVNNKIYEIFPDIIILDNYNNQFQPNTIQIVHFYIFNSQLKDIRYVIGYYNNKTYLIKSYINSSQIVYIFPTINNCYLNFMNNRGLRLAYIRKPEQWHDNDNLLSFYLRSQDLEYYLSKLYYQMELNISYKQFKKYLQRIIAQVKANELLLNI